MFYRGADTSISCQEFLTDTSVFGKAPIVVERGYDYVFLYDSIYRYTVKVENKHMNNGYYSAYYSNCISE